MIARLVLAAVLLSPALFGQAPPAKAPQSDPNAAPASIRLESDQDFARGQDWDKLFRGYESRGSYRSLAQLSDGCLLVADTKTYNFLIFDARGRFLKTLWAKGRRDGSSLTVYNRPEWISVWDGRLLFVSEMGRVRVFDLEGRQKRTSVIDHPVTCLVPVSETIAAVAGWVQQADDSVRYVIALMDLVTGRETVLRDMPEDMPEPIRTKDGRTVRAQAAYARIRPFVRALGEGGFAAGFSNWPEIEVFDPAGKSLRLFRLRGEPTSAPDAMIITKKLEGGGSTKTFVGRGGIYDDGRPEGLDPKASKPKDSKEALTGAKATPSKKIMTGEDLGLSGNPYDNQSAGRFFSTPYNPELGVRFFNFVIDDQGRFLVFSFPESGSDPVLRIYSPAGDLIREAKIETGGYRITFSPGEAGPVFDGRHLITLAEEKGARGVPLRLVKLRLIGL